MPELVLIRHCSAMGQEPDARLTPAGQAQALSIAGLLADVGIDRIVSSPFLRAVDSITPLAERIGVPIELDSNLAERQLGVVEDGDWQGALRRSFVDLDFKLPGGESSREALLRGRSAVDEALVGGGEKVAIVTHGNLLALIAASYNPSLGFDFWKSLTNPDLYHVVSDLSGTAPRLDRISI